LKLTVPRILRLVEYTWMVFLSIFTPV